MNTQNQTPNQETQPTDLDSTPPQSAEKKSKAVPYLVVVILLLLIVGVFFWWMNSINTVKNLNVAKPNNLVEHEEEMVSEKDGNQDVQNKYNANLHLLAIQPAEIGDGYGDLHENLKNPSIFRYAELSDKPGEIDAEYGVTQEFNMQLWGEDKIESVTMDFYSFELPEQARKAFDEAMGQMDSEFSTWDDIDFSTWDDFTTSTSDYSTTTLDALGYEHQIFNYNMYEEGKLKVVLLLDSNGFFSIFFNYSEDSISPILDQTILDWSQKLESYTQGTIEDRDYQNLSFPTHYALNKKDLQNLTKTESHSWEMYGINAGPIDGKLTNYSEYEKQILQEDLPYLNFDGIYEYHSDKYVDGENEVAVRLFNYFDEDIFNNDVKNIMDNADNILSHFSFDRFYYNDNVLIMIQANYDGAGFIDDLLLNNSYLRLKKLADTKDIAKAYLGVVYKMLDIDLAQKYKLSLSEGALINNDEIPSVRAVTVNSPAYNVGLKYGDVILEIADEKLTTDNTLSDVVAKYAPGDEAIFKVWSDGRIREVNVVFGDFRDFFKVN